MDQPRRSASKSSESADAEESLRRLARALIASALDAYELQHLMEPDPHGTSPQKAKRKLVNLSDSTYNRPRKRWGRAA